MTAMLSVVIPTLNAAGDLERALDELAEGRHMVGEIIVADGGSDDGTREWAARRGARVIEVARGRGGQLAEGAAVATQPWLLFLHADTRLAPGWAESVAHFVAAPGSEARAAAFRFALDDDTPAARRIEVAVDWRCRRLGLPYGDQGLLIARSLYTEVGGFRSMSLMEDVDLIRRIGRSRLTFLDVKAVTSAARYRRGGYLGRSARNLLCLGLYFLGLPPRAIVRLYG
jgi:rSAM/selenodomain-associated transferase 2